MSEIIRGFRITNAPYRKGQPAMDGRTTPFTRPIYPVPEKVVVPKAQIEGLPLLPEPPEDTKRRTTNT